MSQAKSVVKTFNKQPRPSNDIQIFGWPLSVMACIAHMQPGEGKGMVQGFWGENPSNLPHWSTFSPYFLTLFPLWLPGGNGFIQLSGWVARPGEESEIHCSAVPSGMFSEKTRVSDAIFCTSSASPSRNSPFPQTELSRNSPFPQFEVAVGEVMLWWSNTSRGVSAGVAVGIQSSLHLGIHSGELGIIPGICKRLLLPHSSLMGSNLDAWN